MFEMNEEKKVLVLGYEFEARKTSHDSWSLENDEDIVLLYQRGERIELRTRWWLAKEFYKELSLFGQMNSGLVGGVTACPIEHVRGNDIRSLLEEGPIETFYVGDVHKETIRLESQGIEMLVYQKGDYVVFEMRPIPEED